MGDFVVFSDASHDGAAARGFGRRAAQAVADGSCVIIADPGWRQEEFFGALRAEFTTLGISPHPRFELEPLHYPEWVFELALKQCGDDQQPSAKHTPVSLDFLDPFLMLL